MPINISEVTNVFQSTLPVWGATPADVINLVRSAISIHAPRVGSDFQWDTKQYLEVSISIHAPRVGSDHGRPTPSGWPRQFQSTLPVWGATALYAKKKAAAEISIHAPRVGSDYIVFHVATSRVLFQSTLPVWGATPLSIRLSTGYPFQSTLPVWGATLCLDYQSLLP